MDLVNGEKEHFLNEKVSVHFKGEGNRDVDLLVLSEPRREHIKYSSKLKQMVMRAMMEISEKHQGQTDNFGQELKQLHDKTDEEHQAESEEMYEGLTLALHMSKDVDLGDFIETFISMALKPAAKKPIVLCDGEVAIKDVHFNDMSEKELTRLAITYASFFSMPSVLQSK